MQGAIQKTMGSVAILDLTIFPILAIVIYIVVFIIAAFVLWGVDWAKIMKRENKTSFMVIAIYVLSVLCVTFLVGSLFVFSSSLIGAMI